MKKLITISLLSIYLLSATEAHQLLKLPVIFYHFAEHKQVDKTISFVDFLAMHYLHGSPPDKDYERDMQLPFKACVNINTILPVAPIPHIVKIPLLKEVVLKTKRASSKNSFTYSPYLADIWQPPKLS